MIQSIVFDIGQVLLTYIPHAFVADRYAPETAKKILETLFLSDHWLALDRGTTDYATVIATLSKQHPEHSEDFHQLLHQWTSMLQPIQAHVALLKQLKAEGYQLYYLSNFQQLAFEEVTSTFDFFALFDGGVVSYQDHLMKPEAAIYQTLLERYQLIPEQCVFVDDSYDNIIAAKALGFHSIHVTSDCKLEVEMETLISHNKK